ncbi:hypothetical protein OTU49_008712 [Cherax quadricarinatus]|uniref:Uncharacterized protein n=1 Tax=Cherax quadricarinatus TaxID=27406 RepID=A0AAW0WPL1_CHEQU
MIRHTSEYHLYPKHHTPYIPLDTELTSYTSIQDSNDSLHTPPEYNMVNKIFLTMMYNILSHSESLSLSLKINNIGLIHTEVGEHCYGVTLSQPRNYFSLSWVLGFMYFQILTKEIFW